MSILTMLDQCGLSMVHVSNIWVGSGFLSLMIERITTTKAIQIVRHFDVFSNVFLLLANKKYLDVLEECFGSKYRNTTDCPGQHAWVGAESQ